MIHLICRRLKETKRDGWELRATCCMVQDILNDVEWSRRQLMMTMLEPEEIALEQLHQCLPGEEETQRHWYVRLKR